MESKMLTSHDARDTADKMISTIKMISDSLAKDSQTIQLQTVNQHHQIDSDDEYYPSDESDDDMKTSTTSTASTTSNNNNNNNEALMLLLQQQVQLLMQQQIMGSPSVLALEQQILQLQLQIQNQSVPKQHVQQQQRQQQTPGGKPLAPGGVHMGPCKMCSKDWTMTPKDQKFYDDKNIPLTKTCVECRQNKKKGILTATPAPPVFTTATPLPPVVAVPPKKPYTKKTGASPKKKVNSQPVIESSSLLPPHITKCKVCSNDFALPEAEKSFFESNGIPLRKTCEACRIAKKLKKNSLLQ
ncbi:hypothetical protein DFA_08830 [Cavenderia fasciculata]|uniref:Uncharacterized protein n=1 Tax=Cavenderia fasciculata TaxID=261658 RepID=F4Q4I0_CACFS|nr:uncharacterized protein DFA_08830 [Cavenderia fasciculata]EGG17829.1 hypothetical protein DFA_08830 [Cavenderia fasciculata]|eukprot:XP_004356313.1 hypothetical protein DFA_08830 [Cavenderia fasciculata]